MPTPKKQAVKKTFVPKIQLPKGPFHFSGRKFNIILILSVIGLCFVLYGNSIPNEFSLDDEFVLHGDSTVAKGISGIPELFKKRYAWDQKGGYGYRPLVKVSFALEYAVFKDSAHWGHFINILIYAFICIFLFYFLRKLLYEQLSDYFLLAALALFVTHPIHSEVVVSLKNRDELLVFIFGLFCSYASLKWFEEEKMRPRVLWGLAACISLGLGALCKPDALIFIPITAMILFFFTKNGIRGAISSIILLAASIVLSSAFVHKHILPHSDYHRTFVYIENPLVGVHWYHKIPLAFSTISFYVGKMVFPKDLICYYGYNAFDAFPKWTDFAVIAGILLTGLLIYLVVKNIKKKNALLFFLLFLGGTIAPYTDLYQVGAGIVAERFMFIPTVAFTMLIIYLLFYLLKIPVDKKPFGKSLNYIYAFTIGVSIIYAARVIVRNPNWKSHQSVYLHDSQEAPGSAKLHSLLAATYIEQAQKMKAAEPQRKASVDSLFMLGEKQYQASLDVYPRYGTSWNNLGMIQYTLYGNLKNAIADFNKALAIDSEYTEALFNMGACTAALAEKVGDTIKTYSNDLNAIYQGKYYGPDTKESLNQKIQGCIGRRDHLRDLAEANYLHTVRLKPTYYTAYIYLQRLYFTEERYDKAIDFFNNAIAEGHESDVIYVSVGNAYLMKKDTANAVVDYEKSIRFYDKNYYICDFLKKYYYRKGDMEKARYYKGKYDTAIMYKNSHSPMH
ncbi:MAG TPA: hypothetical protein VK808_09870 [Bacteroidia bacterium]|nr:hypothetical protein [Bacteroidia bacterium]